MSDDAYSVGRKQHVSSVHNVRTLFQVSNPFWPPITQEHSVSSSSCYTRASRRNREGVPTHQQQLQQQKATCRPETFVVDIPVHDDEHGETNTSCYSTSERDRSRNASASESRSTFNDRASQFSYADSVASDWSTSSGEESAGELQPLVSRSGYDTDTESESTDDEQGDADSDTEFSSYSSDDADDFSNNFSAEETSDDTDDDEVDSIQINRNINAKKREKKEGGEDEGVGDKDKKGDSEESGGEGEGDKGKKKRRGSKERRGSSKKRRRPKGGGDESGKESSGEESTDESGKKKEKGKKGSKRRQPHSKHGSKKRHGSKKDKGKGTGDKKGKKGSGKGTKGKGKKKGTGGKKGKKKGSQKKGQWNKFFNIFSRDAPYPPSVYFILGSEFCERFTYYGLRSILVMYLTSWLGVSKNNATAFFHLFSCLAYFSPIIGAIIADGFLGRYKTILYISFVYTIGCIIMSVSALPPPEIYGPLFGLFLISMGTGGIKPCVVTFGGDQFPPKQIRRRATFFSTFYFIINIGSMLSTFITPVLRSDVHCVEDSCYPLAFGVPAVLMTLALIVFFAGHGGYKHVEPTGSLFSKTIKCICHAMGSSAPSPEKSKKGKGKNDRTKGKGKGGEEKGKGGKGKGGKGKGKGGKGTGGDKDKKDKKAHWLDAAADEYEPEFIEEVKRMTRLIWLFVPLPVFWALFNQQGSRWTLQASQLDGTIGLLGRLKPDQMQALNPLFIILLIPVFERVIYPCINSCGVPNRALQRMVVGMMFGAFAFVLAAMLQMKIDSSNEEPLHNSETGYTIINTVDCKLTVSGDPEPFYHGIISPFGKTEYQRIPAGLKDVTVNCPKSGTQGTKKANLTEGNATRIVVTLTNGAINLITLDDKREKSTNGTGYVSFLHLLAWVDVAKIRVSSVRDEIEPVVLKLSLQNATFFHVFEPGSYQISFPSVSNTSTNKTNVGGWQEVGKPFEVGSGGVYTVALIDPHPEYDLSDIMVEIYVNVKENSLSMMLMIPQYIVITVGEILFSISGLAFAYTQAPESMKSVIQACWLLTTSIGDLIVVIVAEIRLVPDQMTEFVLFAGLMLADAILFAVMSCFYTYVDPTEKGKKKKGPAKKKKKGGAKTKKGSGKDKKRGSKSKRRGSSKKGKGKGKDKDKDKDKKKDKGKRRGSKGNKGKESGGEDDKKNKSKKRHGNRGSGKGRKKKKGKGEDEDESSDKKKRPDSSESA